MATSYEDLKNLCKAYIVLELELRLQQLEAEIQKYEVDLSCSAADVLQQKKGNFKTLSSRFVLDRELKFKMEMIESLKKMKLEAKKLFIHNMSIIENSPAIVLSDLTPINPDFPLCQVLEYVPQLLEECRRCATEDGVSSLNDKSLTPVATAIRIPGASGLPPVTTDIRLPGTSVLPATTPTSKHDRKAGENTAHGAHAVSSSVPYVLVANSSMTQNCVKTACFDGVTQHKDEGESFSSNENHSENSARLETKCKAELAGGLGSLLKNHSERYVMAEGSAERMDAVKPTVLTDNCKEEAQRYLKSSQGISGMTVQEPDEVPGCAELFENHRDCLLEYVIAQNSEQVITHKKTAEDYICTEPGVSERLEMHGISNQAIDAPQEMAHGINPSVERKSEPICNVLTVTPSIDCRHSFLQKDVVMDVIDNTIEHEQEVPTDKDDALTGGLLSVKPEGATENGCGPQPVSQASTTSGCQAINSDDYLTPQKDGISKETLATSGDVGEGCDDAAACGMEICGSPNSHVFSVCHGTSQPNFALEEECLASQGCKGPSEIFKKHQINVLTSAYLLDTADPIIKGRHNDVITNLPKNSPKYEIVHSPVVLLSSAANGPAELSLPDVVTEGPTTRDRLDAGFEVRSVNELTLTPGNVDGQMINAANHQKGDGPGNATADTVRAGSLHAVEVPCRSQLSQNSLDSQSSVIAEPDPSRDAGIAHKVAEKLESPIVESQGCELPNDFVNRILIDVLKLEPAQIERMADRSSSFAASKSSGLDDSVTALQTLDNSIVKAIATPDNNNGESKPLEEDVWVSDSEDCEMPGAEGLDLKRMNKFGATSESASSSELPDGWWNSDLSSDEASNEDDWEIVEKRKKLNPSNVTPSAKNPERSVLENHTLDSHGIKELGLCLTFEALGSCPLGETCKFRHRHKARDSLSAIVFNHSAIENKKTSFLMEVVASNPLANERFSGENSIRRKTEMCQSYKKGRCMWGNLCNYAHSTEELTAAREKYKEHMRNRQRQRSEELLTPGTKSDDSFSHDELHPMSNGKFSGKNECLRKTEMCENFKLKNCHWGDKCNYAHSREEMEIALKKLKGVKEAEKPPAIPPLLDLNLEAGSMSNSNAARPKIFGYKTTLCKGFEKGTCKLSAEQCNYAHSESEIDPKLNHPEPCKNQFCPNRLRYEKLKTKMCPAFNHCKWGESCGFAHSESELRPMPKTECCSRVFNNRKCLPTAECPYAHSIAELQSKISEKKIITKETLHNVHASPSGSEHIEPCSRQHCPGRLKYELYKTSMCPNLSNGCKLTPQTCSYAHSKSELRPLPKREKCSKFFGCGKCFPTDKCPYAHSDEELLSSSQPSVNLKPLETAAASKDSGSEHTEPCNKQHCSGRLRYELYKTSMCPNLNNGCKLTPQTCSYAHSKDDLRPLPKKEKCSKFFGCGKCFPDDKCPYAHSDKELLLSSQRSIGLKPPEAAAKDSDVNCIICFEPLNGDRKALDCGHNSWHFQCILHWVDKERKGTCPKCRKEVPPICPLQVPPGLSDSDFPLLITSISH